MNVSKPEQQSMVSVTTRQQALPEAPVKSEKPAGPLLPPKIKRNEHDKNKRRRLAVYQSTKSAIQALRAKKMRSLLTSLGIIIGVAAVIIMISTSESNAAVINQRLSGLNPDELVIRSSSASTGGVRQGAGSLQSLTRSDADAIGSQVPHASAVSPIVSVSGQVVFQGQNWATSIQGVYPNFLQVGAWQMQEGSFFSSDDEQNNNSVAVIGQTVADNLFTTQGVDPLGQEIRIRNEPFTIVGVLAAKGANGGFTDPDDILYVPASTAQQRLTGSQFVSSIDVLADSDAHVTDVQNSTQQLLEQLHHIGNPQADDFTIQNQSQILQTAQATSESLTILLISVAAVSLVVGGIGIMNIMLVSVTERTREIGIRIAIGAHPTDVMLQFLIEALMLSALGGLAGILIGGVGAYISALVTSRPFALDPLAVLLAFGFAALVGVVFGFYPAQRAARLDPIIALRTE